MTNPFNLALHDHLLSLGYTHDRADPEWEDVGGPESGPDLVGHDGYDVYTGEKDHFAVSSSGEIEFTHRDLEHEAWLEAHDGEFEQREYRNKLLADDFAEEQDNEPF